MRKFIAVLLALAMLLAVGCSAQAPAGSTGGATSATESTASTTESTASTTESSEEASSEDGVGLDDVLSAVGDLLDGSELPTLEVDGMTFTYGDKIDLEAMAEKYPDARWVVGKPTSISEIGVGILNRGWPITFDEEGFWVPKTDAEPDPWISYIHISGDSPLALGGIHLGDTYEAVMEMYPMASAGPAVDVETAEEFDLVVSYLNGKPESPDVCNWFIDAISLGEWTTEKGHEYVYRTRELSPVLLITIENGVVTYVCVGDRVSITIGR